MERALTIAVFFCLFIGRNLYAGGFEFPDNGTIALGRGGAFTVKADDLTAIQFNPAGLVKIKGSNLLFNSNIVNHNINFLRQDAAGTPYDSISNSGGLYFAPFITLSSNFGSDDFTLAAGIYGPSAYGKEKFPKDGPQKYMLVERDNIIAFGTLAAGYRFSPLLSVGASLQWVYAKSRFSQVIDSYWQDSPPEEDKRYDVFMDIKVTDIFNFTGIIGALFQPSENFEIGLAVRPIPVKFKKTGNFEFEYLGQMIKNLYENGKIVITDTGASFEAALPVTARLGARYIHKKGSDELFDIELDFTYEWWSILDKYHLEFDGGVKLYDGDPVPLPNIDIPKKWKDTFSVRLGGDFKVLKDYLKLRCGGFYETAAVPNSTTHLDFLSFDRFGISGGLTFTYSAFDFSIAYMHIFQIERTVEPGKSEIYQQRPLNPSPLGTEVGAGKYSGGFDIFSAGLSVNLDKIF